MHWQSFLVMFNVSPSLLSLRTGDMQICARWTSSLMTVIGKAKCIHIVEHSVVFGD